MSGPVREAVVRLARGDSLGRAEAHAAVGELMDGGAPDALLVAFLTALAVKGETADELSGAVDAVLERMAPWTDPDGVSCRPLLDTCGTGGDGANTVNISTAAAVVAASAGASVAKHGNRSASGNSGSAEVLAELGVEVEASPGALRRCLAELGLTFLYAPKFHTALRHAAGVRRQLPFRTLFNLVGPLANPARPEFQVVGVSNARGASLVAGALARLGIGRAAVVRGDDGLDEVTLGGPTHVLWVEDGEVAPRTWTTDDFGLPHVDARSLAVDGPKASAAAIRSLFEGADGPVRWAVLANAAAGLLVAGRVGTLLEGVDSAARAIDSGAARDLLGRWGPLSRSGDL